MARHPQQHHSCQESPAFLYDALYCSEDNYWEEDVKDFNNNNCFHIEDGGETNRSCYYTSDDHDNFTQINIVPLLLEQDLSWEDDELSSLFDKEEQNQLYRILQTNPSLADARRAAVHWMLNVIAHYSFTPLTAVLAVNYLDRFLVSFHFQTEKPWTTQLAAVACLSLAAKVEETQVPLLLDLQVEDSKYVFEAKTIQRMEILVLSTLRWKMNPVTPVSFLDYFIRRLGLKGYLCVEFLRRCERVLLSIISDFRSMRYLPSVVATAAMLHVINGVEPFLGAEYQSQLLVILKIDEDKVEDCSKVIMEAVASPGEVCGGQSIKRKFGSSITVPGSPNGVMDLSFSSDSSNDSWAAVSSSVSSSPEPLSKKSRVMLSSLNHAAVTADFLSISR